MPNLLTFSPEDVDVAQLNNAIASKTHIYVGSTPGCDYYCDGSNDVAQAQVAVDTASSLGGGIVEIRPGDFNWTSDFQMKSNVRLTGTRQSNLNLADGKRLNCEGITNFQIDGVHVDSTAHTGEGIVLKHSIRVINCQDFWINNTLIDAYAFGIFIGSSDSSSVVQSTQKFWIVNNKINGLCHNDLIGGGPFATGQTADFKDGHVFGNHLVQDLGATGAGTYYACLNMVACKGITWALNTCEGSMVVGFEQDPHFLTKVLGNTVKRPKGATTQSSELTVRDDSTTSNTSTDISVGINTVEGGRIYVAGKSGERLKRASIVGNIVKNDPALTGITQRGIWLSHVDDSTIGFNTLYGKSGSSYSDAGIYLNESSNNKVADNRVEGYAVGLHGAGTSVNNQWNDNYVADCTATVASAPMAADGASFKNNYGINPDGLVYAQGSVTGATTFDRKNGDVITATLTGNITVTLSTTRVPKGSRMRLVLTQDGSGNHTVTWPSNFKKVGGTLTLSTGAAAVDVIDMEYNGTNWNEVSRSLNLS